MSMKVLLADDHEIVREGFKALIEKQPDMSVIAEAANGKEAIRLARELTPDVVVMDVAMPELNGIEATKQIAGLEGPIRIVALSIHSESHYVGEMLKAGASGYLLKNCAFQELARAIRAVMEGRTYLSEKVQCMAAEDEAGGEVRKAGPNADLLSPREKEVLQLLAEGWISKEIASRLHVSVRTVDAHRQHIMDKLGIRSIAELTRFAIREGITFLDSK